MLAFYNNVVHNSQIIRIPKKNIAKDAFNTSVFSVSWASRIRRKITSFRIHNASACAQGGGGGI